jgi:hypothetical protein
VQEDLAVEIRFKVYSLPVRLHILTSVDLNNYSKRKETASHFCKTTVTKEGRCRILGGEAS